MVQAWLPQAALTWKSPLIVGVKVLTRICAAGCCYRRPPIDYGSFRGFQYAYGYHDGSNHCPQLA